ncbi:hypothetical protein [Pelagibacterium lentulum]|uniref:hypothetical protein n=1 Tax=Pelagibacterium lentulum TaxID=2029865 RepID=UPI0013DFF123|nr:hypothetical protein [Pelagibacterium lentulum]
MFDGHPYLAAISFLALMGTNLVLLISINRLLRIEQSMRTELERLRSGISRRNDTVLSRSGSISNPNG